MCTVNSSSRYSWSESQRNRRTNRPHISERRVADLHGVNDLVVAIQEVGHVRRVEHEAGEAALLAVVLGVSRGDVPLRRREKDLRGHERLRREKVARGRAQRLDAKSRARVRGPTREPTHGVRVELQLAVVGRVHELALRRDEHRVQQVALNLRARGWSGGAGFVSARRARAGVPEGRARVKSAPRIPSSRSAPRR
jgi:hypothetical protein